MWTTILWQGGSAKRIRNGDQDQEIAAPTGDEDWIEPDFTFDPAAAGATDFENGQGSWWSAVRTENGAWPYPYIAFTSAQVPGSAALQSPAPFRWWSSMSR